MLDLVAALGLMLVIEGCVFAACPGHVRHAMLAVAATPERMLRTVGLIFAFGGLVIVWLVRG
jgi:uncharacterized protein